MQEAADDLVSLYKRVSLDDDLDDALRSELLSQLSAGLPLSQHISEQYQWLKPVTPQVQAAQRPH